MVRNGCAPFVLTISRSATRNTPLKCIHEACQHMNTIFPSSYVDMLHGQQKWCPSVPTTIPIPGLGPGGTVNVKIYYCLSGAVCHFLSPSDPSLRTVPLEDGDVSEEVPRVGLEEMLQEMNISDEGGGGARGEQ